VNEENQLIIEKYKISILNRVLTTKEIAQKCTTEKMLNGKYKNFFAIDGLKFNS
jgi:hypothetical protein